MAKFWARWHEPKVDPWQKAQAVIAARIGEDNMLATDEADHVAGLAIVALKDAEFAIEWPFWDVEQRTHMVKSWISGEAASGDYCVVCALFEAPDEDTVRREIGERESVDVDQKPDDWSPGDRFQ